MNLIELFDQLELPTGPNERFLSAIPLPGYPQFRIATDIDSNPVLLFATAQSTKRGRLKNVRLKYLSLAHEVECKIIENAKVSVQIFTVIAFTNPDRHLREYFLRISETLVKSLAVNPTEQQIADALFRFVEVFQALSAVPTSTIQGLWAELFLINISSEPTRLLEYWHRVPEEKFAFNAGAERIEVKSSATMERVHSFSSEQLSPPQGVQVLIASILVKQTQAGRDIQDLLQAISERVAGNLELIEKLQSTVSKTLGSSLEHSIATRYDSALAETSLRFYRHQDVQKIDLEHIPSAVSEVKYWSDLSNVPQVEISTFGRVSGLFRSF